MDDLISRQAVIERLTDIRICLDDESQQFMDLLIREINDLPSAEPERCKDCGNFNKTMLLIPQPEIIHCKDCEYYHPSFCEIWSKYGTVQTRETGYCYMAGRRTDEGFNQQTVGDRYVPESCI